MIYFFIYIIHLSLHRKNYLCLEQVTVFINLLIRGWLSNLNTRVLDESQNLTASQLKTIITRCGAGTKIICSGNLAQIDSYYLTPLTSGLTYLVERFKNYHGSATMNLNGVVRSSLAQYAEENL